MRAGFAALALAALVAVPGCGAYAPAQWPEGQDVEAGESPSRDEARERENADGT